MKTHLNFFGLRLLLVLMSIPISAHVGSPGVIFEGEAGPYKIMVNVNPPEVIPGTAQVQVYVTAGPVNKVWAKPIYWYAGGQGSPRADEVLRVEGVAGQYEGVTWLMDPGAASIEITIEGALGKGTVLVPVMATSTAQKEMEPALGWILAGLGLFLVILMVTIIGASVSDALIVPGESGSQRSRRKIKGMVVGSALLILILYGGMTWWNSWAEDYRQFMYKPYQATSTISHTENGMKMIFRIDTSYLEYRKNNLPLSYLIPDHGKLVHMFLVREGSLDAFAHLHPQRQDSLTFEVDLPPLPQGRYFVFADIVRGNGFQETIADTLEIRKDDAPARLTANDQDTWQPSDPDDTYILSNPVLPSQVALAGNNIVICGRPGVSTPLPDGSTAIWEQETGPLVANTLYPMAFNMLDPNGEAAQLEPYMGMMGHAVVMKHDGSVYVHLHPVGNYSSASQNLIQSRLRDENRLPALASADQFRDSVDQVVASIRAMSEPERNAYLMAQMGHTTHGQAEDGEHTGHHATVTFPYAFPEPGSYRIWIQMKRNGQVLNTAFDTVVE